MTESVPRRGSGAASAGREPARPPSVRRGAAGHRRRPGPVPRRRRAPVPGRGRQPQPRPPRRVPAVGPAGCRRRSGPDLAAAAARSRRAADGFGQSGRRTGRRPRSGWPPTSGRPRSWRPESAPTCRSYRNAALDAAQRAVSWAPNESETHLALGFVDYSAGNMKAARAAYLEALRIDPSSSVALNELGRIKLKRRDHFGAAEHFAQAAGCDVRLQDVFARNLDVALGAAVGWLFLWLWVLDPHAGPAGRLRCTARTGGRPGGPCWSPSPGCSPGRAGGSAEGCAGAGSAATCVSCPAGIDR